MYRMILYLLGIFGLTSSSPVAVRDCAVDKSLFKLNSLSVEPETPVSGDPFALAMQWTVPEGVTVTDGTAEYAFSYNYLPFSPTVEPLCQDIQCPMTAGLYQNTTVNTWPSGLKGFIKSTMRWFDASKTLLACVEISGTVGHSIAAVPEVSKAVVLYVEPQRPLLRERLRDRRDRRDRRMLRGGL